MYSEKALKNTIYNVASMLITALATFIVRTAFIKYLGEEILGVNATIVDTVTLLTMSEMGIQTAIIYKMYKPILDGDIDRQCVLFNLYRKAYRIVAVVIFVVGVALLPFIPFVIKTEIPFYTVYQAYILQLVLVVITYFVSYYKIILLSHQRQYIYTRFEVVVNVACSVIKYVAIVVYNNYLLYLLTGYIALLLNTLFVIYKTRQEYHSVLEKRNIPKEDIRSMFSDLKKMVVITISGYVYGSTDSILISTIFGSTLVGLISNYKIVTTLIKNLVVSYISNSVAPSWGAFLNSRPGEAKIREKYSLFTFIEFTVGAAFLLPTWLLIDDFITLWIGAQFKINASIIGLIVLDIFMTSISEPNAVIIRNEGLFTQENFASLLAMVVNVVASIGLAFKVGVEGIFIGTIMADCIYTLIRSITVSKHCFIEPKRAIFKYYQDYLCYMLYFLVLFFMLNFLFKNIFTKVSITSFIVKGLISEFVIITTIVVFWYKTGKIKQVIQIIKKA